MTRWERRFVSSSARQAERSEWRRRSVVPLVLLVAAAAGCGDPPCSATATCPPIGALDATSDAQPNDAAVGSADAVRTNDAGSERDGLIPSDAPAIDAGAWRDASVDTRPADVLGPDGALGDGRFEDAARQDTARDSGSTDGHASVDAVPNDVLSDHFCDVDGGRSPSDNPCLVNERFGVFVSPLGSDATGAGTRGAPFRTLARAVQAAKAETRRVYACDDGTGYVDGVTLDASLDGLELFGGFDCGTWTLGETGRTRINSTSGPALVAKGLVLGVTFERFDFASADGRTGSSSIAVVLDSAANVVLRKARIVAGRGGAGEAGAQGAPGADGTPAGPEQNGARSECNSWTGESLGGTWPHATVCGSRGGTGQASSDASDQQAESGVPMVGVTPPNQWNGGGGILGTPASPGSPGNDGQAGTATSLIGTFSASGFVPAPAASAGSDGNSGQGGGGGRKGTTIWGCRVATGGAGGMGGCGGRGGLGGSGGGASVGMLSWSSSISLEQCEIVSSAGGAGGNGGNGGKGGLGMPGGHGGTGWVTDGGTLATPGENGATGGNGGNGGSGAGGNGGPSYAVVYKGQRPALGSTTLSPGTPGAAGVGGQIGGTKAPDGASGASAAELML